LFLDAAYLSAGFRLFGFDAGGAVLGAFLGARGAAGIVRLVVLLLVAVAGAVTCGYGGVLLTVAAAGVFLSVVGVAEVGLRVFASAPVVAAASAALGCRD
jgi:hypothetical protein